MEKTQQTYDIFNQILDLYGKIGIRSVTMDDIARKLGISKKTIYQHVRDKVELINRVIDLDIDLNRSFITELDASGANAIEDLVTINDQMHRKRRYISPTFYFDLQKYYPDVYTRWIREKRRDLYQIITANISKGKGEGFYREELNGEVIASLYISRMERLGNEDQMEDPLTYSEEAIREIFIYHLHGICNRKGLEYLEQKMTFYDNDKREQAKA